MNRDVLKELSHLGTLKIGATGETGDGKSSVLNTILQFGGSHNQNLFQEFYGINSNPLHTVTKSQQCPEGLQIEATDNPGIFDTRGTQQDIANIRNTVVYNTQTKAGWHSILYMKRITSRWTAADDACVNIIRQIYGENSLKHCVLVLTFADLCDSMQDIERLKQEFSGKFVAAGAFTNTVKVVAVTNSNTEKLPDGSGRVESAERILRAIQALVKEFPQAFTIPVVQQQTVQNIVRPSNNNHTSFSFSHGFKIKGIGRIW